MPVKHDERSNRHLLAYVIPRLEHTGTYVLSQTGQKHWLRKHLAYRWHWDFWQLSN